jgi:quinol-cytochrome oxidoreductase complex cytochrome b subunit
MVFGFLTSYHLELLLMNTSPTNRKSFSSFLLHLHPRTVPTETLRFTLSWGLGGMAALLVALLFLSGLLLLLVYQPSIEQAFSSIQTLIREVPFGNWVRNIHHWSANLLVVIALLHLLRVVLTGGFGPERRFNWIVGLCLLFLLLSSNFTGYLLPWDQLAYWAVTICTSMLGYIPICGSWLQELFRGGSEIGASTLANFFVLHVAFIPGTLLILLLWHFWLVRRAGGLVQVTRETDAPVERVAAVPHLIVREAAVGLALLAFVLMLAIVCDAPLLEQANPGLSPNPAKSPWYFLGFQELLLHLHPVFALFVWPLIGVVALFLLPFWRESALPSGVWFGSARGLKLASWTAVAGVLITLGSILTDNLFAQSGGSDVGNTLLTRGLLPTLCMLALLQCGYLVLVVRLKYSRAETVMAGIAFMLVALTVSTIIGTWFRGAGMLLVWT